MLLLAVVPSIILFIAIWRKDRIEKEPSKLLWKLFRFGALTTVSAIIIGTLGEKVFSFLDPESMVYLLIDNMILTALVEEGGKYFVLKKFTWKDPAFDHTFDAVIYAVSASLGFATLENILYLFDADVSTGIARAIFSVPGHTIFAVFMGCYYGMAKRAQARGENGRMRSNLAKALIIPTLLHGFYDFCLESGYDIFLLCFLVFEIVITVTAVRKVRKLSREDTAIQQDVPQNFYQL